MTMEESTYFNRDAHFRFLRHLSKKEKATLTELSKKIDITQGHIIKIARNLEKDGFIKNIPDPNNRRVKPYALTEKGKICVKHLKLSGIYKEF